MAIAAEPKVKLTLAQFAELEPPRDARFQLDLVDGVVLRTQKPTYEHKRFVLHLSLPIVTHTSERRLGRVSGDVFVLFDPEGDRSSTPDLVFVANEHLDRIRDGKVWVAPDLVVEVLSPSTEDEDRGPKFLAYQRAGVPRYWIVHPVTFLIEEYKLTPEGYLRSQTILRGEPFRPGSFPGLVIDLAALRTN